MGFSKRTSGTPRRPRNPVAKDVRTPLYKPRVEQDKRWKERLIEVVKQDKSESSGPHERQKPDD